MITVMLVDDEDIILRSLVRNIDWQELPLTLSGCFSNSREALEKLKTNPPNILITDIVMPLLSGLDLAEFIFKNNLNTKIIFLSGHQDFEYARQGIRYNVNSFLIKPCEKQQLNDLLSSLAHECIAEKKSFLEKQHFETILNNIKEQLREKLFLDLLHGIHIDAPVLADKCNFLEIDINCRYYVIRAEIEDDQKNFLALHEKDKIYISLYMSEAISSILPEYENPILLQITDGKYAILLSDKNNLDIEVFCKNIGTFIYGYTGYTATFGTGGPSVALTELNTANKCALESLQYKYLVGKNTVIFYEDISTNSPHKINLIETNAIQNQIILAVKAGSLENQEELCKMLLTQWKTASPALIKNMLLQFAINLSLELQETDESLTALFGDENVMFEKILHFDTILDLEIWLTQLLQFITLHIREKKQKNAHYLAQKAALYIDEHYQESVSVEVVANEVFLSPGYLMTIFKREIGVSLNSYLTAKRMEKAKELLLENRLKIYEIALEVGYSSSTFFSSTFRNHVGLSPKQFKEQYFNINHAATDILP